MNSPTCSIGHFGLALLRENAYIRAMSPKEGCEGCDKEGEAEEGERHEEACCGIGSAYKGAK